MAPSSTTTGDITGIVTERRSDGTSPVSEGTTVECYVQRYASQPKYSPQLPAGTATVNPQRTNAEGVYICLYMPIGSIGANNVIQISKQGYTTRRYAGATGTDRHIMQHICLPSEALDAATVCVPYPNAYEK